MAERVMPHNIEAEKSVIGAMIISKYAAQKAWEALSENDFYDERNAKLFITIGNMIERSKAVDLTTLIDELRNNKILTKVGNIDYINELINFVPSAANIDYYLEIVYNRALLRRLINASDEIITKSFDSTDSLEEIVDDAERKILSVVRGRRTEEMKKIQNVLQKAQADLEKLAELDAPTTGLPSGFKGIDRITAGFHKNEMTIIAARPGMGKTAFSLNLVTNVATATNKTVAVFNLEMGAEQLANRMIANVGEIESEKLKTGRLKTDDWHRVNEAISRLADTNIYIDDTAGINVSEIRSKCRRLATSEQGLGLVVIDYLQLLQGSNRYAGNRVQEVSEISRALKLMAMELEVPVIALAQLSRDVEKRVSKKPMLSDLRESGSIEQDADVVAFLHSDDYYEKEEQSNVIDITYMIQKHRNGPIDNVNLKFIKNISAFRSFRAEN